MTERNLNFDEIIDRKNTKCLKYDFALKRGYPKEVLPLWVADMDFRTTSFVEDALISLARHNIYGYSNIQDRDGFFDSVAGWMRHHHRWKVRPEWHVITPGVCFAIATAIRAVTDPGDSVLIQQPVYYPFCSIIRQNGREMVSSDLVRREDGRYEIDFTDFEQKILSNHVKLFILCSPHNPVGRVWTREELYKLGQICRTHGVIVFSDEIHFDFVWSGEHQVFQENDASFADFTITATSPSKTFNLAGLQLSNIFIANDKLRHRFKNAYYRTGMDEPNIAGLTAARAAYEYGDVWYEGVKTYISENIIFAKDFLDCEIQDISMRLPEGTYLLWLDFTRLGLTREELDDRIIHRAGLWLDSGWIFGKSGEGFQRINAACPRAILEEALDRIKKACR